MTADLTHSSNKGGVEVKYAIRLISFKGKINPQIIMPCF